MADETPALQADADTGDLGPRKSFWGHLGDLRTALVRSAISIGIALLACLFLEPWIVRGLMRPIEQMNLFEKPKPSVTIEIGSTQLGPFEVTRQQFPGLPPGDAPQAVYRLGTVTIAGQEVATLVPDPTARPPATGGIRLHNLGPSEPFMVAFHVALYSALAVSSPFWIYFLGAFILPALNRRERSAISGWIGWSAALFLAGALSTYFVLLPVALRAAVAYSDVLGFSAQDWRADDYISFVCKFILGMGLGFQFPLVILFLVRLGILTHAQLSKYRRHVAVLSLILGAVLTTPEVLTQVAMAVPLYLLYEACIWIAWYWERKKRRAGATPA